MLITGIISSSVTLILTTIGCFIIGGCVCTNLNKCAKGESKNATANNPSSVVLYEDVAAAEDVRPIERDSVELRENVAYTHTFVRQHIV